MIPEGKTPISYLHELCNKTGMTPQYNVIANEGTSIHHPEFVMQVVVGDKITSGKGSSKKKAKHAAALALVKILTGSSEDFPNKTNGNETENGGNHLQNPIGELLEFTVKHHLKPPEFEYSETTAPPQGEVQFQCLCKLGKRTETGVGTSKKQSKRNAALNMLTVVRSLNVSKAEVIQDDVEEDELQLVIDIKNKIEQAKDFNKTVPISNDDRRKEVSEYFRGLAQAGCKGKLSELENTQIDVMQILEVVAKSQKITLKYINIEHKNRKGQHQCLLELSTMPVAILHGTGPSESEAKHTAALNALEYLKVMLNTI